MIIIYTRFSIVSATDIRHYKLYLSGYQTKNFIQNEI